MLLAVYLGGVACCWSFNNSVIDLLFFAVQLVVLSSWGGGGILVLLLDIFYKISLQVDMFVEM